jgi:type I restriction enzyme S subunit
MEWLGRIPEHWEIKRLKYLSTVNDDVLPETTEPDFGISYVDISSVDAVNGITQKEEMTFENAPSRARRRVQDGDIVVSTVRTYLRAIAPVLDPEPNMIVSTGFAVVRPGPELNSHFAAYALRSPYFVDGVVARSVGVSYPAINATEMTELPLALTSIGEQQAIAAFLDRETSHIDELIAKKQRQIELLQEKRSALISHVVTKGLDPDVKMKDSGVEWLGEIPEHWRVFRAKVVFHEVNERSITGEEELLTVSHITGVTRRSEKDVSMFMAETLEGYKKCRAGDLIINTMWAWMGAMGMTVEAGLASPSYNVYRFRTGSNEPRYYDLLFRTQCFISMVACQSQGVWKSRLRLYPEAFFEIPIPCPPYDEQRAIVDAIEEQTGHFESLKKKIELSISVLNEYRTALISAAVTGKIDVREEVA